MVITVRRCNRTLLSPSPSLSPRALGHDQDLGGYSFGSLLPAKGLLPKPGPGQHGIDEAVANVLRAKFVSAAAATSSSSASIAIKHPPARPHFTYPSASSCPADAPCAPCQAAGLFDQPYTDPALLDAIDSDAHRALAKDAVIDGATLLQVCSPTML